MEFLVYPRGAGPFLPKTPIKNPRLTPRKFFSLKKPPKIPQKTPKTPKSSFPARGRGVLFSVPPSQECSRVRAPGCDNRGYFVTLRGMRPTLISHVLKRVRARKRPTAGLLQRRDLTATRSCRSARTSPRCEHFVIFSANLDLARSARTSLSFKGKNFYFAEDGLCAPKTP